jgi:hypothetical protein
MVWEVAARSIASTVESPQFRHTVTALILVNAIIVGLDTYPEVRAVYGDAVQIADRIVLYLFAAELTLRFFAASPPLAFFRSGWNVFDLVIVALGFLPASEFFTVARLFRIIRVLRAVSVVPDLQKSRRGPAAEPALVGSHRRVARVAYLRLRRHRHIVVRDHRTAILRHPS